MPFEFVNKRDAPDGLRENLDWLYTQEYKDGENHVTESLLKWFFFSRSVVQEKFLADICQLKGHDLKWNKFNLQKKGKTGTPDAILHMETGLEILFEVKIKEDSVHRSQLKRHLNDAGIKKTLKRGKSSPILILITPDDEKPRKLDDLPPEYLAAIRWVPWIRIMKFLSKRLNRGLHSSDRFLRDGLLILLKEYMLTYLP